MSNEPNHIVGENKAEQRKTAETTQRTDDEGDEDQPAETAVTEEEGQSDAEENERAEEGKHRSGNRPLVLTWLWRAAGKTRRHRQTLLLWLREFADKSDGKIHAEQLPFFVFSDEDIVDRDTKLAQLERFGYVEATTDEDTIELAGAQLHVGRPYRLTEKGFDALCYEEMGLVQKAFDRQPGTTLSFAFSLLAVFIALISTITSCNNARSTLAETQRSHAFTREATRQSNEATQEALEIAAKRDARDAERFERERGLRPAYYHVSASEDQVTLHSLEDIKKAHIGHFFRNIGVEAIDFVRVQVFISFLHETESGKGLQPNEKAWHVEHSRPLAEVVRPGGSARIDLKKEILEQLANIETEDASAAREHNALLNVKVAARIVGMEQPTSVGLNEEIDPSRKYKGLSFFDHQDRDTITVRWTPALLQAPDVANYIETYTPEAWVSN